MLKKILTDLPLYIFAKDKNFKYLFCNEKVAEAAGVDSPQQIIGKTDYEVICKKYADSYRKTDIQILNSKTRVNIQEVIIHSQGIPDVFVTKTQLMDGDENCIGIIGFSIDITGYCLTKKKGNFDPEKQRFYLGEPFCNVYLTRRELEVFRYLLCGYTLNKISFLLKISPKTTRWYICNLKIKLQCQSKSEIMSMAIQHGLTYILEEHKIWESINNST